MSPGSLSPATPPGSSIVGTFGGESLYAFGHKDTEHGKKHSRGAGTTHTPLHN